MERTVDELVLRKTLEVAAPPERAFALFTEGIAGWWPVRTHSVAEERAETVVFEPGVGGRIYERTLDGDEHLWGTVTAWDPPGRVACTWHPGREPETAQEVEVRFEPLGSGTRVELVHTGWERLGDRAAAQFENYDGGWDFVFGERFVSAANA
jgi:uncharacterized protein YndB with AHSA1/START domain